MRGRGFLLSEERKIPNKVFVGNLHPRTSEKDLESLFSEVGDIKEVRLLYDADKRSRGCGFVTFAADHGAALAVDVFDGRRLQGRPLRVDFARDRAQRTPREDDDEPRYRHGESEEGVLVEADDDYSDAKRQRRGGEWRRMRRSKRAL